MTCQLKFGVVCLLVLGAVLANGYRQQSEPASSQKPRVSLTDFKQISEGMSTEEVTAVLGEPQAGAVVSGEGTGRRTRPAEPPAPSSARSVGNGGSLLARSAVFDGAAGAGQITGGNDQSQVGKRLGEIAQQPTAGWVEFLRQQSHVVSQAEQPFV